MRFSVIASLTVFLVAGCAPRELADPCGSAGTAVVVDTQRHALWLCDAGRALGHHDVAIGRGGTDKRIEGDGKTPLGAYALGAPRPSRRFGTFIPVAYPTEEQRRQGYTGQDVGIHGPGRFMRWTGMSTRFDWTAGCVAVGSDREIEKIAAFARAKKPAAIFR